MAINPANAANAKRARRQNRNLGRSLQGFGQRRGAGIQRAANQALSGQYDPRQASASGQQDPTQVQGGTGVADYPSLWEMGSEEQRNLALKESGYFQSPEFGAQYAGYTGDVGPQDPNNPYIDDGSQNGDGQPPVVDDGSGWQGSPLTGPIEQGDEAFGQMSDFRNRGLQGTTKLFQELQESIPDTLNRQIGQSQTQYNKEINALREGFGGAENIYRNLQGGVEGAYTDQQAAAQDALAAGEQSAIRGLEEGTEAGVEALNPYAEGGVSAQQQAAALSGALGPEAEAQARAAQSESPYQQYLRDQAEKTILQNASATGGLGGGNVQKALQDRSMALSGQFEQQRMENLMGLGAQGLTATGQQASLYGQQGAGAADIFGQTAQQRSQNEMALGAYLGESRSNQQANLSRLSQEQGISEQEVNRNMMTQLNDMIGKSGDKEMQALLNQIVSQQDFAKMGVDMVPNLIAALNSASPGSSTGGALANAAGTMIGGFLAGGGTFSDIRLKTNIRLVGNYGVHNLYTWDWTEEAKPIVGNQGTLGVIAQEVREVLPEAVTRAPDGYLRVDYSRLV